MGYRKIVSSREEVWREWLKRHRDDLIASSVPSFVFDNLNSWNYFVDHGYVENYETNFVFKTDTLSGQQKAQLLKALLPTYNPSDLANRLIHDLIRVVEET